MTRGRPFQPGNKMGRGRPKGSRNKYTVEAQMLLAQYTEPLIKKCIALALQGDRRTLALLIDRIVPAIRESGVRIKIGQLKTIAEIDAALQRVVEAIGKSHILPSEGEKIHTILQNHRNNLYTQEKDRISDLRNVDWDKAPTELLDKLADIFLAREFPGDPAAAVDARKRIEAGEPPEIR